MILWYDINSDDDGEGATECDNATWADVVHAITDGMRISKNKPGRFFEISVFASHDHKETVFHAVITEGKVIRSFTKPFVNLNTVS